MNGYHTSNYSKFTAGLPHPGEFKKISSTLPRDPIDWTEKTRILNGAPFSFLHRDYLQAFYRSVYPVTLVRKGRQTELTEALGNLMFYNAWAFPQTTGLYATNTMAKAYKFSNRRIRDIVLKYSPIIDKLTKEHLTQQVTLINGSIIYFTSAHDNFKAIRSLSGDFIYSDEIQDQNLTQKANLTEALSHSKFKKIWGVGTGSLDGSMWQKWYQQGTNSEWSVKEKKWIHQNPNEKYILSLHIPQTIVPWITPEEIQHKKATMPSADFQREVMGNWVKGDEIPVTVEMIERLYMVNQSFTTPENVDRKRGPVIVSWDWGGGKNAWTVGAAWQAVKIAPLVYALQLLHMVPVLYPDIMAQAAKAVSYTDSYDPDIISIDSGGGGHQVQEMERAFGTAKVWKTHYLGRTNEPYKLDELFSKGLIKVDRTHSLQAIFDRIKNPHITAGHIIPLVQLPSLNRNDLEYIEEHFTSLYAVDTKSRAGDVGITYERLTDKRSDALHNLNYANVGLTVWLKQQEQASFRVSTGNMGGSI